MARDYKTLLQQLLPPGGAWTRDPGANLTKLLQALGDELSRVEGRVADLLAEFYPDTLNELLSDWERVLGLPEACFSPSTTEERRTAIRSKLALRGGQYEQYFNDLAAAAGYAIDVIRHPYDEFRVGSSAVGNALTNDAWQHVWQASLSVATVSLIVDLPSSSVDMIHALDFGGGLFVAVGEDPSGGAFIATSIDGISWIERAVPESVSSYLLSVKYGNGLWVAGGLDGYLLKSSDGITWTVSYSGTPLFRTITYGNGLWVAVGQGAGGAIKIFTSPDAVTWTSRTSAVSVGDMTASAYGASVFVVCGAGGIIQTSPDGITWTARSSGTSNYLRGICYGERFVAVGALGTVTTSLDGLTWTVGTSGIATLFTDAKARNVDTSLLQCTLDAATQGHTVAEVIGEKSIIAVTSDGKLVKSVDGITWTDEPNPLTSSYINCVTANKNTIVAGFGFSPKMLIGP